MINLDGCTALLQVCKGRRCAPPLLERVALCLACSVRTSAGSSGRLRAATPSLQPMGFAAAKTGLDNAWNEP